MINGYLPILHADLDLKEIFPIKSITTVYRREKNPKSVNSQVNIIKPCNSCDICKHYLVAEKNLTSKITGKTFYTERSFLQ